jgi:hypothetical protein
MQNRPVNHGSRAARKTRLNAVFVDEQPSHDTADQQREKESHSDMKDPS